MRAWRLLLVVILAVSSWRSTTAHADVIGPPSPCPPGQTRYGLGGVGMFGHGGGPRCEPAVCSSSEACGEGGPCVRRAHCLADRPVQELVRPVGGTHGHGQPAGLDPLAPVTTRTVTRTIDVGACDATGHCEAPDARCRMLALCGAEASTDALGPMTTSAAWSQAVDFDPALPLGPLDAPPPAPPEIVAPPTQEPATSVAAEPETAAPSPTETSPAPRAGGVCSVSARAHTPVTLVLVLGTACALVLRPRSRRRRARRHFSSRDS